MDLIHSTTWIVVIQIGAFIGFVLFGYLADFIGRKKTFVVYFVGATIMIPVFLNVQGTAAIVIAGAVMALLGTGFYSGFGPTFAELFPTEIRAFAQGFIYNTGRAVSAAAPALVGFLTITWGPVSALLVTAGFYLVAALLVIVTIPETRGAELEAA